MTVDGPDIITDAPERLHPLFLLTGLGNAIRGSWGILLGGAYLAFQDRWWLAAAIVGAMTLLSLVSVGLKWLKLEYRVGPDQIQIDSGLLSRNSRAIPFDRITDVDIEQGPLQRLLGLARVKLETGASAGSKTDDGVLDTIALARAEAIRDHVRLRKSGATTAVATVELEAEPVFAMDTRRVLLAGLFNFSLAIIAGLFGASQTIGNLVGFDPFSRSFWNNIFMEAGPWRDLVMAHQIISVIGGTIVLLVVGTATGLVRTLLRDHGFRLDRTDSGFRRRRGLLTLTDVSIPARRVQASIVGTGPIRQRFGWWSLKLQSLATDGAHGDHDVAPLATLDEISGVQASIGLPIGPNREAWQPLAAGYWHSMLPLAIPAVLAIGAGFLTGFVSLLAVGAAIPLAIAVRYFAWRHGRYATDQRYLFVERGWWRRRRLVLPLRKIQSIDLNEDFWTRRFDFCSLQLGVAGGSGLSIHAIPALKRVDAEALRAQLLTA